MTHEAGLAAARSAIQRFSGDADRWTVFQAGLDAYRRALHPTDASGEPVAAGWKLVPVDITEEMWAAFFKARDEIFPAQQKAAQAAGRGWKGLPAVAWEVMLAAAPSRSPTVEREAVTLPDDMEFGQFKPCQIINTEAGITEYVYEDAATVAVPVVEGVYRAVDWLLSMDGRRLVGIQFWSLHQPLNPTPPKVTP